MPKCQSIWVHYQYRPCALLSDAIHKSLGYFLCLRGLETLGWKLCKSYKTTTSRESVQIPEFVSSWLPCILEGCFSPVNSAIRPLLASRRNHWEHLLNFVAIRKTCMVKREMRGYIVTAFHVPLPHSLCTHTTTQSLCSPHPPPPTSPWSPGNYSPASLIEHLDALAFLKNGKPCTDQRRKIDKHFWIGSLLSSLISAKHKHNLEKLLAVVRI